MFLVILELQNVYFQIKASRVGRVSLVKLKGKCWYQNIYMYILPKYIHVYIFLMKCSVFPH